MAQQVQDEVIAFLNSPAAYPGLQGAVERRETHGALVFIAGDDVYKIKRAIRFSYMDFSTLPLRRAAIHREFDINRRQAPDIYLAAVPITRDGAGRLAIAGDGEAVEWAVHMRRFDQSDLMGAVADRGALTPQLARALADAIYDSHVAAPPVAGIDGAAAMATILANLDADLAAVDIGHSTFRHEDFKVLSARVLERASLALQRRSAAGLVRRCHGDLHLDNLVLWHGRPTLFDAIEFNEQFATIDTLYDLAFLLMDLDHRGHRSTANIVFNRYLWRAGAAGLSADGLVALPLFLALRSAIRGLVVAQRAMQRSPSSSADDLGRARASLEDALHYLALRPPRLVAVGGLSGSGKTTLAAALAPTFGAAPGALHLRTDLERKSLYGVAETARLPADAYTRAASDRVYEFVLAKARDALTAGHAVVVDAVFSKPDERSGIEAVANGLHIPFTGLWLDAPAATMRARVEGRVGDASDADAAIVDRQLGYDLGEVGWHRIEAGAGAAATLRAAAAILTAVGIR